MVLDPIGNIRGIAESGESGDLLARFEQDQGGSRLYAGFFEELTGLLQLDFGEAYSLRQLPGFLHFRARPLARRTGC